MWLTCCVPEGHTVAGLSNSLVGTVAQGEPVLASQLYMIQLFPVASPVLCVRVKLYGQHAVSQAGTCTASRGRQEEAVRGNRADCDLSVQVACFGLANAVACFLAGSGWLLNHTAARADAVGKAEGGLQCRNYYVKRLDLCEMGVSAIA